jgi:cytochrome P450
LTRFVTADTELGGQQLKQGDLVIAIIGAANRDGCPFAEPTVLDIQRRPNPHLAFGKGAHYCLGAPLARLEGEIALRALFQRFPDLRLEIDPADLEWRDTPIFRALTHLPVVWG